MDREQIDRLWRDTGNWTWGVIYRCREDPRVIVPRRWRWGGWTLNLNHPRAGFVGLAAFGLAVGPGLLTLYLSNDHTAAMVVMLLAVIALLTWAHLDPARTG